MLYQWPIALSLHQLGALIWVGGMFFAHFSLRPAATRLLDPPVRLPLMLAVFDRFFPFIWASIAMLWGSGLWLFLVLSHGKAGPHVHAMMGIAAVMTVIFAFIWFQPYKRMKATVAAEKWAAAGISLALIRRLIATNLALGLATAILASAGPALLAVAGSS